MNVNVGGADRTVRIVAGVVILSLFFVLGEPQRWWALIGFVPLITGFTSRCPAYALLGIKTCRRH